MKTIARRGASPITRGLFTLLIGLVCLFLSDRTARCDSADLSQQITNLQTQADQLSKEIETLKTEVAAVEQKWKKIASIRPPSFHTDASAIQISQLTTAWTKRPDGPAVSGVAPIITFELKNIGAKPITDINLIVSFYKPDKEVIGGATLGLLDSSDAPLRTGMWQKVTIDYHLLQFPETRSAIPLNADLYVETQWGSYAHIGSYEVSSTVAP